MVKRFAIVIGAMKAGTTTIVDNLARHPHVAAAQPKEPGFFAFEEIHAKGADWYESLFSFDPERHRLAIEGSTDYAKYPHASDVAERMRAFERTHGCEIRLIYAVRHPLRRIESHARHVQRTGKELGQRPSDRPDHGLDAGVSRLSLDVARYAAQLDQYRDFVDASRLKIVVLETLSAAPDQTMADLCAYLDLDPSLLPPGVDARNRKRDVRRLDEMPAAWSAVAGVGPLKALYGAVVPERARVRLRNGLRKTEKVEGRFALTSDESAQLLDVLRPDLRRLRDDYGIDVEKTWGIVL
ncbi:MAG: hypothetical protein ACFB00_04540 [Parvularculaceae bacterium]